MTFRERILKWFQASGAPVDARHMNALAAAGVALDDDVKTPMPDPVEFKAPPDPAAATAAAEADTLRKQLAQERAGRLQVDAGAFADKMIAERRVLPAERAALVAVFSQAGVDDAAHVAVVTFGDGDAGKGNRIAALSALFAAREPHALTHEHIANDKDAQVLMARRAGDKADKPCTPERKAELLSKSTLGQAVLAAQRK